MPPRARRAAPPSVLLFLLAIVHVPLPAGAATTTQLDQSYEITATLDVEARRLDVVQRLVVTNRSGGTIDHLDLTVVPRALGYLSMDRPITVDGREAQVEWTTGINLRVPLANLGPRDSAELVIPFSLTVARSPDAFSARTSAEAGVLSFGQWFPIVSTEHDVHGLGDPQISFTADEISFALRTTTPLPRHAVACPGLVSLPREETGTEWACLVEDVRDFSFVVNPRFRVAERSQDEITIRVYTETVDPMPTAILANDALSAFERAYGEYPWADLVLAEVGAGGGFSMEYPRMIHLTRGKVADPYVVYHEVAHQWFYGQLGSDQQREPWVDEAFADYSARWLLGIGPDACGSRPVDSTVFAWEAGPTTGGDWTSCDGYFESVFYRGTEFLNAVRDRMGEDAFTRAMRTWVERNRHGFVTGERLLAHLQARTDADLRPLFDAYLPNTEPWPVSRARPSHVPR